MKYLGHKNFNDGNEQLLKEHLHEVSRLAEKFASEFGERIAGKTVRLYHDNGRRVQNSVFECVLDEGQYLKLQHQLLKTIDDSQDSLRFYNHGNKYQTKVEH